VRFVVALVLACREPLAFAGLSTAASTLAARGAAAVVEFCWAGGVAALSMAAAWGLVTEATAGVTLARAAIVASATRDLQVLFWTALPSDVVPGTRLMFGGLTLAGYAILWLAIEAIARRECRG
jgi:hypothetical protein